MIDHGRIADLLSGPSSEIFAELPALLPDLDTTELLDFLTLLESPKFFKGRLPLRLQIYAWLAEYAGIPELRLLALVRLLRRLGARTDTPNLGSIPQETSDFVKYVSEKASEMTDDPNISDAVIALAKATRAYRSGQIVMMDNESSKGLAALNSVPEWSDPAIPPDIISLLICETGHELMYIASNAAFRAGDSSHAKNLVESWAIYIEKWEHIFGVLARQRYQYYQLVGHLDFEVGLYEDALSAYSKALEYAPTPYRKAFLWLSEAQIERTLGRSEQSWTHAVDAIDAILSSPYPQAALTWIEWLALEAESRSQIAVIDDFRKRSASCGGIEANRITRAMTQLYRVLGMLRSTTDPSSLVPTLDNLIKELDDAGSWPNLVTILVTKAVAAGRLNDREMMDSSISRAREIISSRLAPDARPPAKFFLENAYALALRDVGDYDEAFRCLFEGALEARMKYPGSMGPEERTTLEALYYLGALAGFDPETIEKKIRDTIITDK